MVTAGVQYHTRFRLHLLVPPARRPAPPRHLRAPQRSPASPRAAGRPAPPPGRPAAARARGAGRGAHAPRSRRPPPGEPPQCRLPARPTQALQPWQPVYSLTVRVRRRWRSTASPFAARQVERRAWRVHPDAGRSFGAGEGASGPGGAAGAAAEFGPAWAGSGGARGARVGSGAAAMRCSSAASSASSASAAPRNPAASPKRRSASSPERTLAAQAAERLDSACDAARASRTPRPICFWRSKACRRHSARPPCQCATHSGPKVLWKASCWLRLADWAVTFATSASSEGATAAGAAADSGLSPAVRIILY